MDSADEGGRCLFLAGNNYGELGVLFSSRVIWSKWKRSGGVQQEVLKRLYIVCDRLGAIQGEPFPVQAPSTKKPLAEVVPHRKWQASSDRRRFAGVKSIEWRGRAMKFQPFAVRNSLFIFVAMVALAGVRASAQTKPDSSATAQNATQEKQSKVQPGLKPLPHDDEGREAVQEGPEFLRRRQNWFFQPRSFPIGFIPQGARERALEQKRQMYQREGRLSLFAAPSESGFLAPPLGPTSAWFPIGPQATSTTFFAPFTSGRVTALVVNPNNANNVYLGGADGGLWMTTDGGTNWTPITDFPLVGATVTIAVGALAVDPASCSATICTTVYVGTGEGNFGAENVYGEGVLKCTVTAGAPPTATCAQDNTFHTVSPLSSFRGGPSIGALAVNRAAGKSNILLAGVRGLTGTTIQSGIWCSADSGATWSRVLPTSAAASDPGTDVAFASDGTAWVALGNPFGDAANNGVYKSSAAVANCTITFTKQTLPAALSTNIGRITLALSPSSDATLYTAIADSSTTSSNLLGVAKTTTANTATPTWLQLNGDPRLLPASGICNSQCFYDIPMAVSPASANTVFFGGGASNGTLIRSTDGGSTWTEISRNVSPLPTDSIHVDMHAFGFSSNGTTMYVGNDGGVWKTSGSPTGAPGAGFWTDLNQTLQITQFYPGVSIHPSNAGFAMGGTQDNDVQIYQGFTSPSANLSWKVAELGCDGGFTAIDFAVPSTSYGECEYIPNRPPFPIITVTFAGDGILGNGFLANTGIDPTDRGSFIPPLVMDPNNSNTLYFGTCRIWHTTNGANSWSAISPDVTSAAHVADCSNQSGFTLSTIAIAKGTSNTIYVGSEGGEVEVTSNGGTSWTSISGNGAILPIRAVTQVVVDPSSATGDVAYVAFSGFASCSGCDGKGHIFKTANGTAGVATVWTDVSGTTSKLPDIPVNAIVIDPDDPAHNTLYVGTDVGAFFTTDGGLNWSPLGTANSLPNSQILSLTIHNPSRTLRAATHGRGVWDINLGAGPNTPAFGISKLSPFTANTPGAQTTLTVTGTGFTNNSKVMWGNSQRTTTFVSATQLTATITAADLSAGAVVQVSVQDSALTTNSLPFTVLGQAPTISSVSPTSAPVNSANTLITVTGTNFGSNSKVFMNPDTGGTAIATTFTDSTHLSATVPAAFMANFGSTNSVGVQNPPPGGGTTVTTATVTLPTFKVVAPAPANDNFASAINITSTGFADTKDSSGATTETGDPTPACAQSAQIPFVTGRSNTIWYKVVPTGSGTANIDTIGSSYDSVLSVWSGTSQTALTAVACNDDINPGIVTESQLTNVTLNAGTTYFIMVSSFGQADPNPLAFGGKSILNFSCTCTIGSGTTGSFTIGGSAVTVTAGASGTSTITVTPTGGFISMVNVTCPAVGLPAGVTCSPNPLPINVTSAAAATGQLTVAVAAPSTTLTASAAQAERRLYAAGMIPSRGGKGWWTLSAGTGLTAILLLFLPGRKRYRAALVLGLICVLSFALGCGGGGYGGGGGPVATVTHLTVTAPTKVASGPGNTFAFTVSVTGGTPTGQAQLFDGSTALGTAATVSGGSASITSNGLPVGTHAISAHYLGTSSTLASQSGALNVTVTGTTTFAITATPAASNGSPTVSITIN